MDFVHVFADIMDKSLMYRSFVHEIRENVDKILIESLN